MKRIAFLFMALLSLVALCPESNCQTYPNYDFFVNDVDQDPENPATLVSGQDEIFVEGDYYSVFNVDAENRLVMTVGCEVTHTWWDGYAWQSQVYRQNNGYSMNIVKYPPDSNGNIYATFSSDGLCLVAKGVEFPDSVTMVFTITYEGEVFEEGSWWPNENSPPTTEYKEITYVLN